MKRGGVFLLGAIFLLTGCHQKNYTLENWLSDAVEVLHYDDSILGHWKELVKQEQLNQSLQSNEAAVILFDILGEEGTSEEVMVDLGYFTADEIKNHQVLSQKEGMDLLMKAKQELKTRTFFETKEDIQFKVEVIPTDEPLENLSAGYYETVNGFFEVNQDGEVREVPIEEIIEVLEIETTFQPNLSEGIIFPEGTSFQAVSSGISLTQEPTVMHLKSNFFSFTYQGYKISGSVYDQGLGLSVRKDDFHNMTFENNLSLSQLQMTADVSLNPFNHPHCFFRVDYHLEDDLAVSKKTNLMTHKELMTKGNLSEIKSLLNQLLQGQEMAGEPLELLSFSFPIPGTLHFLKVEAVLSLNFLLNGEVGIHFETEAQNGFQAQNGGLLKIQENSWQVEPYFDGTAELACVIGCDLKMGKYLLADLFVSSGVGAHGKTTVYYVNTKEKTVDESQLEVPLTRVEEILLPYTMSQESYVDLCADIDTYWFVRLGVGEKTSLLRKLGITYSYTPFKQNLNLLHIENHHIVKECTRHYQFDEISKIQNEFQLSHYQVFLEPGETFQLKLENEEIQPIEWSSSDVKIASVEDGIVHAHDAGQATIIVRDDRGRQSSCLIIVHQLN